MAYPDPAEDVVIDLTDSPPASPQPTYSSRARGSYNNLNQPVLLPRHIRDDSDPTDHEAIDLTDDNDDDEDLRKAIALSMAANQPASSKGQKSILGENGIDLTGEGDGDIELERAIALSLAAGGEKEPAVNEAVNMDEGTTGIVEDQVASKDGKHEGDHDKSASPVPVAQTTGFLGLDRKAMEAERLARLKRKRDGVDTPATKPISNGGSPKPKPTVYEDPQHPSSSKRLKTIDGKTSVNGTASTKTISPPPKSKPSVRPADSTEKAAKAAVAHRDPPSSLPSLPQPRYFTAPTLLRTFTPYDQNSDPSQPTTTLSSLLASPATTSTANLKSALLSSFTTDFDFFLPLFDTRTTKFLLILHASSTAIKRGLEVDFADVPNVEVLVPQASGGMQGGGTMHSKFMVLFYDSESDLRDTADLWQHGRCRIAIPTGNLTAYDWGQNGSLARNAPKQARENARVNVENLVWVVDLPVLEANRPSAEMPTRTSFQEDLTAYLTSQGVPGSVLRKLDKVDFTATRNVGFVGSAAGFHFPDADDGSSQQTLSFGGKLSTPEIGPESTSGMGLYSLAGTIRRLNLTADPDEMRRQPYSPIPTTLHFAISGHLGHPDSWSSTKTFTTPITLHELEQTMRIYFPSAATVALSLPGPNGAGTICFAEKWWNNGVFPKHILRDAISKACDGKGLMHAKLIAVRFERARAAADAKILIGWYYVGSGNCSESAWGKLAEVKEKGSKEKKTKLTVKNWETGVVVPVYAAEGSKVKARDEVKMEDFVQAVPNLPWRMPAEGLVESGREPWFFEGGFGGNGGGRWK
ncbi:uncharacterized protein AB675_8838 [Cyphellophora attinorum]|uniref:Tyrosyl-DNA phosphodiesterase 1 n=1 Tax=Cyphellophora attinorum TaxID=1664694 RepID=A0A0N0NR67_9EURO|nr:uncharacterized protein AB675_8838 [Phialophora attinorum]KPI44479.1 hypothetical protein AB675_8838 [Phialophora attinorum]